MYCSLLIDNILKLATTLTKGILIIIILKGLIIGPLLFLRYISLQRQSIIIKNNRGDRESPYFTLTKDSIADKRYCSYTNSSTYA